IDHGLERLRAAVSAGPVESVCAKVMAELVGAEPPPDDIAVLMVRQHTVEADDLADFSVAATPESLAHIRATVRRWLSAVGADADEASELLVAVGEACSNVIEH